MQKDIMEVLEHYWMRKKDWQRTGHYASDITACRRQLFWKWTGETQSNPTDATGKWKMNMGNAIHDLMQNTLKQISEDEELRKECAWEGFEVFSEVRSGDVWIDGSERFGGLKLIRPMRFRVDLLFRDDDDYWCGGEIKSTFGRGVTSMKNDGMSEETLAQGVLYITLGRESDHIAQFGDIRRYYFPIVARDSADRFQFVLEMDGELPDVVYRVYRSYKGEQIGEVTEYGFDLFEQSIRRLQDVEFYIDSGELPPRDFKMAIKNGELRDIFQADGIKYKSDWQCRYCAYREKCWAAEMERYAVGDNRRIFLEV